MAAKTQTFLVILHLILFISKASKGDKQLANGPAISKLLMQFFVFLHLFLKGLDKRVFDVVPNREEKDNTEIPSIPESTTNHFNSSLKKFLKFLYQRIRREKNLNRRMSPIFGLWICKCSYTECPKNNNHFLKEFCQEKGNLFWTLCKTNDIWYLVFRKMTCKVKEAFHYPEWWFEYVLMLNDNPCHNLRPAECEREESLIMGQYWQWCHNPGLWLVMKPTSCLLIGQFRAHLMSPSISVMSWFWQKQDYPVELIYTIIFVQISMMFFSPICVDIEANLCRASQYTSSKVHVPWIKFRSTCLGSSLGPRALHQVWQ